MERRNGRVCIWATFVGNFFMIIKYRYQLGIWIDKKVWAQAMDQGVIREIVWAEKAAKSKLGSTPDYQG